MHCKHISLNTGSSKLQLTHRLVPNFKFHLEKNISGIHLLSKNQLSDQLQRVQRIVEDLCEPMVHTYRISIVAQKIKQEVNFRGIQPNLVLNHSHMEINSSKSLLREPVNRPNQPFKSPLRRELLLKHPFSNFLNNNSFIL